MSQGDVPKYQANPPFASIENGAAVALIMNYGLTSVTEHARVRHVRDNTGERWSYVRDSGRVGVEAYRIRDGDLAGADQIRAYVHKKKAWFDEPYRLSVSTLRSLTYVHPETGRGQTTRLASTLTYDIPLGETAMCRWIGVAACFRDADDDHDAIGEEVMFGGILDPAELDNFVIDCAARQIVHGWDLPPRRGN